MRGVRVGSDKSFVSSCLDVTETDPLLPLFANPFDIDIADAAAGPAPADGDFGSRGGPGGGGGDGRGGGGGTEPFGELDANADADGEILVLVVIVGFVRAVVFTTDNTRSVCCACGAPKREGKKEI